MALLEVNNYKVGFKTERGLAQAVDGVTYTLEAGKTLGIVGESGSGKTVLNRSIMGLIASSRHIESGSVVFSGAELVNNDRQDLWGHRIGMIFQDPMTSLNPVMRIGKQITEPLRQHLGLSKSDADERAIELLSHIGSASNGVVPIAVPHALAIAEAIEHVLFLLAGTQHGSPPRAFARVVRSQPWIGRGHSRVKCRSSILTCPWAKGLRSVDRISRVGTSRCRYRRRIARSGDRR